MHFNFEYAQKAFNIGKEEDKYMNDSTWNVTYVDSHDYGPSINGNDENRYAGGTDAWAENLDLMFTFRGIPCVYYGSEVEFQAGQKADKGNTAPLSTTGRAYFGDFIEGSVDVTDFSEYSNATGTMAQTLNSPLSKHIQRLNKIRKAIPALRRGQYSTEGVSGSGMAFKRRYTADGVDSFVCVAISGSATFTGIPSGTYVDAITGKTVQCNGTLTTDSVGKGNMRVYVLQNSSGISGKIGEDGAYLK
ncbi:MAG: alpha-amylase family glycosyl hydrolase [Clostridium sp.]|nr:alpha-amylase family glycosyl hydrolase [Clostridium sp.]